MSFSWHGPGMQAHRAYVLLVSLFSLSNDFGETSYLWMHQADLYEIFRIDRYRWR